MNAILVNAITTSLLNLECGRFFFDDNYKITTQKTESCTDVKNYLIDIAKTLTQDANKFKQLKELYNVEPSKTEILHTDLSDDMLYRIGVALVVHEDIAKKIGLKNLKLLEKISSLVIALVSITLFDPNASEDSFFEKIIEDYDLCYVDSLGNLVEKSENHIKLSNYLASANNQQKQKIKDQIIALAINDY